MTWIGNIQKIALILVLARFYSSFEIQEVGMKNKGKAVLKNGTDLQIGPILVTEFEKATLDGPIVLNPDDGEAVEALSGDFDVTEFKGCLPDSSIKLKGAAFGFSGKIGLAVVVEEDDEAPLASKTPEDGNP
jgi:hypothetical protein